MITKDDLNNNYIKFSDKTLKKKIAFKTFQSVNLVLDKYTETKIFKNYNTELNIPLSQNVFTLLNNSVAITNIIQNDEIYDEENYIFKPDKAGFYNISLSIRVVRSSAAQYGIGCGIRKNGTDLYYNFSSRPSSTDQGCQLNNNILYFDGVNDYFEITVYTNSASCTLKQVDLNIHEEI